jgi:hypothetical protein
MATDVQSQVTHHVPDRPAPNKRVMKVDLFELATRSVGTLQLVPIFPYMGDGDIVPCLTIAVGSADMRPFQFFHANVVDESVLCLAEEGATMKTGQLMKLAPIHGVNTFLKNPRDPSNYNVMLLPIRMNSARVQQEGFIIRCAKCNEIAYRRDFNVKEGAEHKYYPEFYALRYYAECCREFNSSPEHRTCPRCGTVQQEFPLEQMGWWRHVENTEVANRGRAALEWLAEEMLGGSQ